MPEPIRYIFCWHGGEFVPCGILERLRGDDVPNRRSSRFAYARSWLARKDAVPIDPGRLPLKEGWQDPPEGHQLHGVFRDATPDGWGQRVIEKRFPQTRLGDFDFLSAAGDDRVGMIGVGISSKGPPGSVAPNGTLLPLGPDGELAKLQEAALLFDAGEELPDDVAAYLNPGGSPGGARPKANFRDSQGILWIAKFQAEDDDHEEPRVEAATLSMARDCGITIPEHKVLEVAGHPILLVRRFDRPIEDDCEQRLGFISLNTLLGIPPEVFYAQKSYADVAAAVRLIGSDAGEEMFRRMVFNALIGNSDDHLRNHAVIRSTKGTWNLSPAFDMVPQPRGDHTHVLRFATSHVASIADVMNAHGQLAVSAEAARAIAKEVAGPIRNWRDYMDQKGVTEADINWLTPAFLLASGPEFEALAT